MTFQSSDKYRHILLELLNFPWIFHMRVLDMHTYYTAVSKIKFQGKNSSSFDLVLILDNEKQSVEVCHSSTLVSRNFREEFH